VTRAFGQLSSEAGQLTAARTIATAYEDDPAAAAAEYGAEFRRDVESFVAREAVEACVIPGRRELLPVAGLWPTAFVDPSGGSQDSMTLAIAHQENGRAVLDAARERRPHFSPDDVVREFAATLKAYRCAMVIGDRYGGEWPRERFAAYRIGYHVAEQSKSDLYRDLLPLLNSGTVDLLDDRRLIAQLCGLERRTARGGRDSIDVKGLGDGCPFYLTILVLPGGAARGWRSGPPRLGRQPRHG
jgi:hypothetical protein